MKAVTKKVILGLAVMLLAPMLVSQANAGRSFNYWDEQGMTRKPVYHYGHRHACCCNKHHTCRNVYRSAPVVAACTTSVSNKPLPTYVCCSLLSRKGHYVWRNTWVSGSCAVANPYARQDSGCRMNSPVYDTGLPIPQQGSCQFTGKTAMSKGYGYYYNRY